MSEINTACYEALIKHYAVEGFRKGITTTRFMVEKIVALEEANAALREALRAAKPSDRAERDKHSPAEAEAAETESLAHQIVRLASRVDRLGHAMYGKGWTDWND